MQYVIGCEIWTRNYEILITKQDDVCYQLSQMLSILTILLWVRTNLFSISFSRLKMMVQIWNYAEKKAWNIIYSEIYNTWLYEKNADLVQCFWIVPGTKNGTWFFASETGLICTCQIIWWHFKIGSVYVT